MNTRITQLFILFFAGLISNCNTSTSTPGSTKITTGKSAALIDQTINRDGGKIVIDDVDGLRGLTIDIPANAYTESRGFHISYATIEKHDLGPDFNPVAPMIIVSNGGGEAEKFMTMKIPVKINPGEFAMAFYYDDASGALEGIPLIGFDEEQIIIAPRHFAHSNKRTKKRSSIAAQAGTTELDDEKLAKIVITAIREDKLLDPFDSGFIPGVDDCPTVNYGSSYAPKGFCVGQSLLNMWYYLEKKKKGAPPLHTLLDNDGVHLTPDIWQDDVKAIKLCSMIQKGFRWFAPLQVTALALHGVPQLTTPDKFTYYAFAYAIKLTGEPQFVNLLALNGHAMIVYKVRDYSLYIADPNFPGNKERRITYDPGAKAFIPYMSGENASFTSEAYNNIIYVAKSSMPQWSSIPGYWEQAENNSIGKDAFPDFTIVALNEEVEFVPLEDGFKRPDDGKLTLNVRAPGLYQTGYEVIDENGQWLPHFDGLTIDLPRNVKQIGVKVTGAGSWAGFKWIKVGKKQKASYYPGESGD